MSINSRRVGKGNNIISNYKKNGTVCFTTTVDSWVVVTILSDCNWLFDNCASRHISFYLFAWVGDWLDSLAGQQAASVNGSVVASGLVCCSNASKWLASLSISISSTVLLVHSNNCMELVHVKIHDQSTEPEAALSHPKAMSQYQNFPGNWRKFYRIGNL